MRMDVRSTKFEVGSVVRSSVVEKLLVIVFFFLPILTFSQGASVLALRLDSER